LLKIKAMGTPIPFPTFSGSSVSTPQATTQSHDQFSHLTAKPQELHGWAENFNQLDNIGSGFIQGTQALTFFQQSGLPQSILGQIWTLADVNKDGKLDVYEFCVAMFLIQEFTKGHPIPPSLPESLRHSIWNASSQTAVTGSTPTGPYAITPEELATDTSIFQQNNILGFIEGNSAVNLLSQSGLAQDQLGQIYMLADTDKDGKLHQNEFLIAMKIVRARLQNHPIPTTVPPEILASINRPNTQSHIPQSSTQIFEQRIIDLQDRCNKADNEIASLKVRLQTGISDKEKAESLRIEYESRALQAEARVQTLGSKNQEETSQALQKINELSTQLTQAFSKIEQLNSLNSALEVKLQQANTQLQSSQSQLQNAQHQISVSAFSSSHTVQPTSPWGSSSTTFGGSASSSLPPPITSPTSYSSTPTSPFGGSSTTTHTPTSPFGVSSTATHTPTSPFGHGTPSTSQPQNPFLMGMNF